jgi:hypothetical protein
MKRKLYCIHLEFNADTAVALLAAYTTESTVFWDVASFASCLKLRSSETSVLTRPDSILHSRFRENLKFHLINEKWRLVGCYAVWLL